MPKKRKPIQKKSKPQSEVPVVDVYSLSGKKVDKFKLDPQIFSVEVNKPLLHQAIVMYSANKRQGTASTKTRANVRGGGKKPWRQKGTGRARVGSIRSPLWRSGGIVFGPHPRDYSYSLPKKMRKLAVISSLSAKTRDNQIVVLEKEPELKKPKTRDIAKILFALKSYKKKILFLCSQKDNNLVRSCRNIENLTLKTSDDFNAYDVISNSRVLFSKGLHESLVKRFKK